MTSPSNVASSVDYTQVSPVKNYMYGTSSLPEISPSVRDLNKSQDYSNSQISFHNDISKSRKGRKKKNGKKKIKYTKHLEEEGTEMFNALMENKTSEFQMRMVSNRLKRLEFEEQRARDKILKSQYKAELLQKQKEEKERHKEMKRRRMEMQKRNLENMRREHTMDRLKMKQHIKNLIDTK